MAVCILVIDDDSDVRKTLSLILETEGYSVQTAKDGKQAIKVSERGFFDVALIDIKLPDMDGTELLERLKEKGPKMVKIMITGYPSLANTIKAVNKGADGYVLKPFDAWKLLKMIRKHLNEKSWRTCSNMDRTAQMK